jgi:hypothetical protein
MSASCRPPPDGRHHSGGSVSHPGGVSR